MGGIPFGDYELVIVDSWGASTEGIEDRDGGRTGTALASLLELARRGPAVIVLMNVPKDGKNYRGSGVIADRLDVLYEVRDITDLHPSAKAASWWSTLADQSESGWQERAKRRRRRDNYRLALVASKFRIGEEPDPIAVEIRLGDVWTLHDVTGDLEAAHECARGEATAEGAAARERACDALATLVAERHATGKVLLARTAEDLVRAQGLTQREAREIVRTPRARAGASRETDAAVTRAR